MDPTAYRVAVIAAVGVALLFVLQTMVGMVARIRAHQPGGVPIEGGPERFLYRADRARANTIEVLGVFVLILFLALGLKAPPGMVNAGAAVFLGARALHTAAYYSNRPRLRSLAFMGGNVGMIVILVAVLRTVA